MENSSAAIGGATSNSQETRTIVGELVTVDEIITAHKKVVDSTWKLMDAGTAFVHLAADCGDLIIKKKSEVGHGNFLPWLAQNIKEFGERTARDYMKAARYRHSGADLTETTLRQIRDLREATGFLDDKPSGDKGEQEKPPFVIRCAFNKDPLEYDEMEWSSFVESLATADEKRRQKGWIIQPPQ